MNSLRTSWSGPSLSMSASTVFCTEHANLGFANGDLGDATGLRDLLERALAFNEREYGPVYREVASKFTSLGLAYGDLGDSLGSGTS